PSSSMTLCRYSLLIEQEAEHAVETRENGPDGRLTLVSPHHGAPYQSVLTASVSQGDDTGDHRPLAHHETTHILDDDIDPRAYGLCHTIDCRFGRKDQPPPGGGGALSPAHVTLTIEPQNHFGHGDISPKPHGDLFEGEAHHALWSRVDLGDADAPVVDGE